MVDLAISPRRASVAAGITVFHIFIWATFTTYLEAMRGRAEGLCLFRSAGGSQATWQDCIAKGDSLDETWIRTAVALLDGYWLPSAVMLVVWIAASVLWFLWRAEPQRAAKASSAPAHARIPYSMRYDSAAVIFVWSAVLAMTVGMFTLASLLLFFVLALVLAVGRGLAER